MPRTSSFARIKPVNPQSRETASFLPYGLLRKDFDTIVETIPTIVSAIPIREMRREIRFGGRKIDGRLVGCTPEYAEVTRLEVDRGHFISDAEVEERKTALRAGRQGSRDAVPLRGSA